MVQDIDEQYCIYENENWHLVAIIALFGLHFAQIPFRGNNPLRWWQQLSFLCAIKKV